MAHVNHETAQSGGYPGARRPGGSRIPQHCTGGSPPTSLPARFVRCICPGPACRGRGNPLGVVLRVDAKADPGTYRTVDSSVYTDEGQETFRPCPPIHIAREMESLLDWTNRRAPALHPLVAATVFFHEFESIHPFLDGNGRVGRTLFHLYLQQHGLANSHLCMVEKELTTDPETYYQLLAWTDQSTSYAELLDYFSAALLRSYEAALKRIEKEKEGSYGQKNQVLYYLDHGADQHDAGKFKESEESFEKAERRMEELYTKSVSRAAGTLMRTDAPTA